MDEGELVDNYMEHKKDRPMVEITPEDYQQYHTRRLSTGVYEASRARQTKSVGT